MEQKAKFQALIEKFDFSELTKEQQQDVLLEMTEKEYEELREVLKMTTDYFDMEPQLFADNSLKPQVKKTPLFLKIIHYKVPIYKVAAALILIFSINFFVLNNSDHKNRRIEIAHETGTAHLLNDTLSTVMVGFEKLTKFSSNNSIKYNQGLAKLYSNE